MRMIPRSIFISSSLVPENAYQEIDLAHATSFYDQKITGLQAFRSVGVGTF